MTEPQGGPEDRAAVGALAPGTLGADGATPAPEGRRGPDVASDGPAPTFVQRLLALGPPLFAAAIALAAAGYFVEALRYARSAGTSPGPGLFPQIIAVALFVAAVGTVVTTHRAAPLAAEAEDVAVHPLRAVAVGVAGVLFVGTLSSIGFFFAAALALVVVEAGMGVRNPFRVALFALLLAFVAQVVFVDVLGLEFFSSVHVLTGL